MQNIILNLTLAMKDDTNAPKLLTGTGNDKTYLCVLLTAIEVYVEFQYKHL